MDTCRFLFKMPVSVRGTLLFTVGLNKDYKTTMCVSDNRFTPRISFGLVSKPTEKPAISGVANHF